MLTIAVIGDYQGAKRFVEYKFKNLIKEVSEGQGYYTLINGDVLYLCYGEPNKHKSMDFDAYIITPSYWQETLEDVIKHRVARERPRK